ncbi:SRPBCC family protein [Bdellovibrionota bacterium FG-1]
MGKKIVIFLFVFQLVQVLDVAQAYDSRFGINPSVQNALLDLAQRHVTQTVSNRVGDLFSADASAVMDVDPAKVFAAGLDYDHFVQFGMPHLSESVLVERTSPDLFYVFSSMSYLSLHSSQYMEVRVHRNLGGPGSAGVEWQLTPKQAGWPHRDSPAFNRMEGSFYVEPLSSGGVYMRYYLANRVDLPLTGLLSGFIQSSLRSGAADVIKALARQAWLP